MSSKKKFYDEMARGCERENKNEVLICFKTSMGTLAKRLMGLKVFMEVSE